MKFSNRVSIYCVWLRFYPEWTTIQNCRRKTMRIFEVMLSSRKLRARWTLFHRVLRLHLQSKELILSYRRAEYRRYFPFWISVTFFILRKRVLVLRFCSLNSGNPNPESQVRYRINNFEFFWISDAMHKGWQCFSIILTLSNYDRGRVAALAAQIIVLNNRFVWSCQLLRWSPIQLSMISDTRKDWHAWTRECTKPLLSYFARSLKNGEFLNYKYFSDRR